VASALHSFGRGDSWNQSVYRHADVFSINGIYLKLSGREVAHAPPNCLYILSRYLDPSFVQASTLPSNSGPAIAYSTRTIQSNTEPAALSTVLSNQNCSIRHKPLLPCSSVILCYLFVPLTVGWGGVRPSLRTGPRWGYLVVYVGTCRATAEIVHLDR
jgi:hypothetical protein